MRVPQSSTPELPMQEINGSRPNGSRAFNGHQLSRSQPFTTSTPPASTVPLSRSLPEPSTSLIHTLNIRRPYLSTFRGTSQYSLGAPSACGVASVNAVREILQVEQSGRRGVDLLLDMDTRQLHEDIMAICTSLTDATHLEVDEIMRLPIFDLCLDLISLDYKVCSKESFLTVMKELGAHSLTIDRAVAAIITRAPEIISVICIPLGSDTNLWNLEYDHVFAVFDSHPRPASPHGAAITFFSAPGQAATYLSNLFSVDPKLLRESGMQWEAQLFSTFSAHIVAATPYVTPMVHSHPGHVSMEHENKWDDISPVTRRLMYVANIELLQARTRIRDLEREVVDLRQRIATPNVGSSSMSPEDGVLRLNNGGGQSGQRIKRSMKLVDLAPEDGFGVYTLELGPSDKIDGEGGAHAILPVTGTNHRIQEEPADKPSAQYLPDLRDHLAVSSKHVITLVNPDLPKQTSQGSSISTDIKGKGKEVFESGVPPPLTGRRALIADNNRSDDTFTSDYLMALELQLTEDGSVTPLNNRNDSRSRVPISNRAGPLGTPRTETETDPPAYNRNDAHHSFNPASRSQNSLADEGASMLASDHEYALGQQLAFEREEREIEEVRARLAVEYPEQKVFECGICLDMSLIDFATPVDGCKHVLCRNCLREYVVSRLGEGRYPIVCPMCSSDKIGQNPGFVTAHVAEHLGLSQDQYDTWTQLDLAQYSVVIDCPHCHSSSLVDREDYHTTLVVQCPLFACGGAWCKECSQLVDPTSGPHSCDGQAEMDRYIQSRSLKRCPGCTTPTEHISGCNHMTCVVPGCNTHFCYVCGKSIIRSIVGAKIKAAIAEHYSSCRLFEY